MEIDHNVISKYLDEQKSIPEIAEEYNTYPNKIRRYLIKNGTKIRDKSASQKIALQSGRATHPTEGIELSEETKTKISEASSKTWASFSKNKKDEIKKKLSESWKNRDPEVIEDMKKKALSAMNKASREGSKLENFLVDNLYENGYNILAHKKGLIANSDLEPDLIIPELKIVIEIDGPTHFLPIFGEEKLHKTIQSDNEKNALFLQNGFFVLRVKHICKTLSEIKKRHALKSIIKSIEEIKKMKSPTIIEIEV